MAKIDLEKLICSFIERTQYRHLIAEIQEALKDQGLECKEGQVVEIEYNCTGVGTQKEEEGVLKEMINKPLEIKAGHWYVCIKGYGFCEHDYLTFEKGKIYKSEKDKELTASDGGRWPFGDAKDYFRPATEDEIPHEPKFRDDDWVVCEHNNIIGKPVQYKELKSQAYKTFLNNIGLTRIKPNIRLWTIQDAKDGDVLYSKNTDAAFIFKRIDKDKIRLYCDVDFSPIWKDKPKEAFGICDDGDSYGCVNEADDIHPATQEQRALLFQKMAEAGYEWDAEKKELRKIQKPDLDNTNGTNTIKFDEEPKN